MSLAILGPIMGPLASRTGGVGTVTYEPTDTGYTVAIGGVPFFIAPKDDTPYQRATAQFRKQQFDAAQSPGDQSLDGLWLRGQFSFHRGAGVRFFESLDGDVTANRFNTGIPVSICDGCSVFEATPSKH